MELISQAGGTINWRSIKDIGTSVMIKLKKVETKQTIAIDDVNIFKKAAIPSRLLPTGVLSPRLN